MISETSMNSENSTVNDAQKKVTFASFSIITVEKSCRHRSIFIPRFHDSKFIPSFSHSIPSTRFLPCFLISLLPQREKVVRTHKKLLLYLAFKSLYNSGAEWELITPCKRHKFQVSEASVSAVKAFVLLGIFVYYHGNAISHELKW